jgi:transposase
MPESHRKHQQWTPGRLLNWALSIGTGTRDVVRWQLENRPHPEQGYRACLGILRLARRYGVERLEAACGRGLDIGARSYGSIRSILEHGLDRQPRRPNPQGELALPDHPNLRGSRYYH